MVDTLKGLKPGNIVFAGDDIFKIAKMGPVQTKVDGGCTYEVAIVRTTPPGFSGGELGVGLYGHRRLACLLKGNVDAYHRALAEGRRHGENCLDLACAAVGEGEWIPFYDVKGFTKLDLIAYVIAVHGPSLRDDIMRRVAALESLPWIPTSNTEYFSNTADVNSKARYADASTESTMCKAGKQGRKQLYGLGEAGRKRAAEVLARLGEGPARQVDGSSTESKAVPPVRRAK